MSNYVLESDPTANILPVVANSEELFYFQGLDNADHAAPEVSLHLFEAVSMLEPISVRVGALEGQDWYTS
jgi:hypothetical protein